jgi:hypothetical protein
LVERLTLAELQEWEAFDQIEPVGKLELRMEYMLGTVCAVIVNMVSSIFSKKGAKGTNASPYDFMPPWDTVGNEVIAEETPKQSVDEMKQFLLSMAKVQNTKHPGERRRRK